MRDSMITSGTQKAILKVDLKPYCWRFQLYISLCMWNRETFFCIYSCRSFSNSCIIKHIYRALFFEAIQSAVLTMTQNYSSFNDLNTETHDLFNFDILRCIHVYLDINWFTLQHFDIYVKYDNKTYNSERERESVLYKITSEMKDSVVQPFRHIIYI